MKIIDAHTHIFEHLKGFNGKGELRPIGNGKARWASGEIVNMIPPELGDTSFSAETLHRLLSENGVERAVLLQGSFYGFQNEYVAEAVRSYPDMFLGAGTYDPFGLWSDQIYDRITNEFGMKAIKFETSTGCGLMSYHTRYDIAEVFDKEAARAAAHGQTLVLDIGSPGMDSFQPEGIRRLADRYPELKIVVCHLLAPGLEDEEALKRGLEVLAAENIWFDLAAVPFNVKPETYPYPTGACFVKLAANIVGYKKLIWGTDVPSVLCYDSYQNLLCYLSKSGWFSEEELQAMLYDNAMDAYPFV